jgi:hypothetical protein
VGSWDPANYKCVVIFYPDVFGSFGGRIVPIVAGCGIFQHFWQRWDPRIENIDKFMHSVSFEEWQQPAEAVIAGFGKKIVFVEQISKVIAHPII